MPSRKWRPASSVRTSNDCKARRVMLSSRNAWRIGTIRAAGRLPEASPRPSNSSRIARAVASRWSRLLIDDWLFTWPSDASADRHFNRDMALVNRFMTAQSTLATRRCGIPAIVTLAAMAALAALTADAAARQARPAPITTEATAPREAGEPIMAIVSIGSQQVTFYDADGRILR